jgi:ATP-binding cassette, subfamily C, bacterial exporter for protease/lipase
MKSSEIRSELKISLNALRPHFKQAAFFSLLINLLILAPTIYMLEVYDRVVNSRNGTTLLMLTVLVLAMYALMELLEWVRNQVMHSAGLEFDKRLGDRVFNLIFEAALRKIPGAGTSQPLTDLRNIRAFFASPAVFAIMDAPVSLFFLILIFLVNLWLGMAAVVGALLAVFVGLLTERGTQAPLMEANKIAIEAQIYANNTLRNAEVIEAMGMLGNVHRRWMEKQRKFLSKQAMASDVAGGYTAISKLLQVVQGSLLLGLGCWFLLKGELHGGGGMMLVGSILGARVLAPLVQVVGSWRQVVNVRDAYARLDKFLQALPAKQEGMSLPAPKGLLTVENVMTGAPGNPVAILRGVNFALPAGETLAVVGPSASGKSTLARLLVGVWPAANGKVRLDGIDVFAWNKAELGPHVGYLPQDVELFDGTLAENIARFGEMDRAAVIVAAKAVGLHDVIEKLPDGYDSAIGDDGCFLSGGQRQRVGLARAIYGAPKFVVLDEPNSSLDEAGEYALAQTLLQLKAQGTTVVLITHRTNILSAVDRLLVLRDGQVQAYGPRDEVLAALSGAAGQAPAAPAAARPLPIAAAR